MLAYVATLPKSHPQPKWITVAISAGAGFFLFALLVAAFFEADIRALHAFQALIYLAVIVLTYRKNAFGFGAGICISLFWNYVFLRGAFADIAAFLSGRELRPDIALQLGAVAAHCAIIVACTAGFARLGLRRRLCLEFGAGGVVVFAYMLVLIILFRPQTLPVLKHLFGLA